MYSVYKLNKQGDNIQPCHTPFPIWNEFIVPYLIITTVSWPAYRSLRWQVRWPGSIISLGIFHSLMWSTQSLQCSQWSRSSFSGNSIAFSIIQQMLTILPLVPLPFLNWASTSGCPRFRLLKPSLKDFEHHLSSMWNELNCTVVSTFFGITLLWDWNENWPFPVLWWLLSFPNLLAYWVQHFYSLIF